MIQNFEHRVTSFLMKTTTIIIINKHIQDLGFFFYKDYIMIQNFEHRVTSSFLIHLLKVTFSQSLRRKQTNNNNNVITYLL